MTPFDACGPDRGHLANSDLPVTVANLLSSVCRCIVAQQPSLVKHLPKKLPLQRLDNGGSFEPVKSEPTDAASRSRHPIAVVSERTGL